MMTTTGGRVTAAPGRSGFTGEPTGGVSLLVEKGLLHYLYEILYTEDRQKRVPHIVLNADDATWKAFLAGYNLGDGLQAGHGQRTFKHFKTSSPTLAAGLWWMASQVLDQKLTLNVEFVSRGEFGNAPGFVWEADVQETELPSIRRVDLRVIWDERNPNACELIYYIRDRREADEQQF